jgi:hypothetical protein
MCGTASLATADAEEKPQRRGVRLVSLRMGKKRGDAGEDIA